MRLTHIYLCIPIHTYTYTMLSNQMHRKLIHMCTWYIIYTKHKSLINSKMHHQNGNKNIHTHHKHGSELQLSRQQKTHLLKTMLNLASSSKSSSHTTPTPTNSQYKVNVALSDALKRRLRIGEYRV